MIYVPCQQNEAQGTQFRLGRKAHPFSFPTAVVSFPLVSLLRTRRNAALTLLSIIATLVCQSSAFASGKPISFNTAIKRQLEETARVLHISDIHSFKNGQLNNDDLVDFGVTIASFEHHLQIFPVRDGSGEANKGFVPTRYVKAEVAKYFGKTVSNTSTKRYHYKNGSYAVENLDPMSAPGGYRLSKVIQTGDSTYTAVVNLYGLDGNDQIVVYATERIDLRKVTTGAKSSFLVTSYHLQDRQPN